MIYLPVSQVNMATIQEGQNLQGSHSHCCVPLCSNDARNKRRKLSFHRFPKQEGVRKLWITKVRRDVGGSFKITDSTRVCSDHFPQEDFRRTLTGIKKLNQNAVPSVFNWSVNTPTRPPPKERNVEIHEIEAQHQEPIVQHIPQVRPPQPSFCHDYDVPRTTPEMLSAAQQHIDELDSEVEELKGKMFFLERFSSNASMITFYTGFKNYETLKAVYHALEPTAIRMVRWTQMQRARAYNTVEVKGDCFREEMLPLIDQFFLFLTRVRQGFFEADLATRFNISQATVSRILTTWANYLYFMLGSLPIWPDRCCVDKHMPECFKSTYPKTRVILDCTEIFVQTPTSKVLNSKIYSNYKSHATFKGLLGIGPAGAVVFVSSLYTGGISDKAITAASGILSLIEPNDEVMADKGFTIEELLMERKASLTIPPFLGAKGKFSKSEVSQTQEIARLRIHVERAIRRIKEYHIFDSDIPLSLAGSINQVWTVCALLTNFKGPLF